MNGEGQNETPLRQLAAEILNGTPCTDVLDTEEKVVLLRESLEKATKDAYEEFAENQLKSLETAQRHFIW